MNHSKMQDIDAVFISKIEEVNWLTHFRADGFDENDPIFNGFMLLIKNLDGQQTKGALFLDN